MLPRIPEPEAMDSLDEAVEYDRMDHAEVNRAFVADFLAASPVSAINPAPTILDLGTGTALIPIQLCRQLPQARVTAVDLAHAMLHVGRQNVERAGLADRIAIHRVDVKRLPYPDGAFDAVISNSLIHHIPEPPAVLDTVLSETWRVLAVGGRVFFRDLIRPKDEETLGRLVHAYAADATEPQRRMFADSLRAALTVDEVRHRVARFGGADQSVQATSDRHWTWSRGKDGGTNSFPTGDRFG